MELDFNQVSVYFVVKRDIWPRIVRIVGRVMTLESITNVLLAALWEWQQKYHRCFLRGWLSRRLNNRKSSEAQYSLCLTCPLQFGCLFYLSWRRYFFTGYHGPRDQRQNAVVLLERRRNQRQLQPHLQHGSKHHIQ